MLLFLIVLLIFKKRDSTNLDFTRTFIDVKTLFILNLRGYHFILSSLFSDIGNSTSLSDDIKKEFSDIKHFSSLTHKDVCLFQGISLSDEICYIFSHPDCQFFLKSQLTNNPPSNLDPKKSLPINQSNLSVKQSLPITPSNLSSKPSQHKPTQYKSTPGFPVPLSLFSKDLNSNQIIPSNNLKRSYQNEDLNEDLNNQKRQHQDDQTEDK